MVAAAREAMKTLLKDGTIILKPNEARTALIGAVCFNDLGDHILGLAGTHRSVKAVGAGAKAYSPRKSIACNCGSGGRI